MHAYIMYKLLTSIYRKQRVTSYPWRFQNRQNTVRTPHQSPIKSGRHLERINIWEIVFTFQISTSQWIVVKAVYECILHLWQRMSCGPRSNGNDWKQIVFNPFNPIRPYMASRQPLPIMMAIFLGYLWTVSHIFNL